MQRQRRRFLHLAAGAAALPLVNRAARAQAYPARPVRIVVGVPPGGPLGIAARPIGQWLSERPAKQSPIETRPGAGPNIATALVAHAAPDAYTLLLAASPAAINATLYTRLNFNFVTDIAPVAALERMPLVMAVHPALPVKTVPEFIDYAKSNPGKVNMGSGGIGSTRHVSRAPFH